MAKREHRHFFAGRELGRRSNRMSSLSDGLSGWLTTRGMDPRQVLLSQLWKNWSIVMGPLADIAHPLGHRNGILLIGGDDPCAMQELSYAVPEILERANAFMDEGFFTKVELHLLMGQHSLRRIDTTEVAPPPPPARPPRLGQLELPPDSPLAAAYAAYVKLFQES